MPDMEIKKEEKKEFNSIKNLSVILKENKSAQIVSDHKAFQKSIEKKIAEKLKAFKVKKAQEEEAKRKKLHLWLLKLRWKKLSPKKLRLR